MKARLLDAAAWVSQRAPFIALWTDAAHAYALLQPGELLATPLRDGAYPALSPRAPGAAWFERLAHDLNGATAAGAVDTRPAVEQLRAADGAGTWPEFAPPLGQGVHQVAVGPVFGTVTEPAHFRASVLGEQVLKLEIRHGYAHRGILAMIRGKSPRLAARFAARISGDATVAHSLAFAHAAEAALGLPPPPRAATLRGVMAELERIANHTGDLGEIAGLAGNALLQTRLDAQRETFRAAAQAAFGHRLMMDLVIPGGIAGDLRSGGAAAIGAALAGLEAALPALRRMFDGWRLQDRLAGTGAIASSLAAAYAPGGFVGRACGLQADARQSPGYEPYAGLAMNVPVAAGGDAAARVWVRLAELSESVRLIRLLLRNLPEGTIAVAPPLQSGDGLGVTESFRGPVWYWLSVASGTIADVFVADASTLHWPLLEQAAIGGLAEFPLIAKSVGASCAGVDL